MCPKERKRLRIAIHGLIEDNCLGCPKNTRENRVKQDFKYCEGCPVLEEMQALGSSLVTDMRPMKAMVYHPYEVYVNLFKQKKYTQKQIAAMLNVSNRTVSKNFIKFKKEQEHEIF